MNKYLQNINRGIQEEINSFGATLLHVKLSSKWDNELNYQDHLALENVISVGGLLVVENKR